MARDKQILSVQRCSKERIYCLSQSARTPPFLYSYGQHRWTPNSAIRYTLHFLVKLLRLKEENIRTKKKAQKFLPLHTVCVILLESVSLME